MKNFSLMILVGLAVLGLAGCPGNATNTAANNTNLRSNITVSNANTTNSNVAVVVNSNMANANGSMVDSTGNMATPTGFITEAATGGTAEVELGKLAASKAQNADVKAFGQKMVEDHSKVIEDVKALMIQKKVLLPSSVMPTHIEVMDKLSKLSGADFDQEYVKAMVAAHEKDVAAFENVSKTAADADVKAFAIKTLPTLKMHLKMIKGIQGKMK